MPDKTPTKPVPAADDDDDEPFDASTMKPVKRSDLPDDLRDRLDESFTH